tara:strand:- start:737 stop:1243 length:507 start_codon:yes stop_codon:yes gene_type:complete
MENLEIKTWPDKSLSLIAKKVLEEPCDTLVDSMIKTMNDRSGIGLAAPQIGVSKRIITLSKSIYEGVEDSNATPEVMINPEIVDGYGEIALKESCLSIPGSTFWVQRANIICVKYEDKSRQKQEELFSGLASIVIQHECDHLDGITLADKADIESRRKIMSGEKVSAV